MGKSSGKAVGPGIIPRSEVGPPWGGGRGRGREGLREGERPEVVLPFSPSPLEPPPPLSLKYSWLIPSIDRIRSFVRSREALTLSG